jgi:hypothetical protein
MFVTSPLKWNRAINEKDRVIHIIFFVELCGKLIGYHVCSSWFKIVCSKSFDLGSTAAYSQYCSSFS